MAVQFSGRVRQVIALVRSEGPVATGARIRASLGWRTNKLIWRTSARVPAVAAARRSMSRLSRKRSGRRERASLGHESLDRAESVLRQLAPMAIDGPEPSEMAAPSMAVGIVVPAYQAARWLDDCLESVSRQTYREWRCYIVDDASNDETSEIAQEWERRDPRFRLIRHGKNGGLSAARNTGLRETIEPIVTFLDADDLLAEESLARRVRVLQHEWENPAVAGAWATTPQVPEETSLAFVATIAGGQGGSLVDFVRSRGECPFNAHAPVMRTELARKIGGFDERMQRGAEDWDFWQRLLRHGYVFKPAGGIAGVYRQRRSSMVREDPSGHLEEASRLLDNADCWALTTPELVVDPHAGAALPTLFSAERLLRRGVTYAGIHLGTSGVPAALDDPAFSTFVRPVTSSQAEASAIGQAARAGLHRGLGLGVASSRLDPAAAAIVDGVGRAVVARLAAAARAPEFSVPAEGATVDCRVVQSTVDLMFVAESAADVVEFMPMVAAAKAAGQRVGAIDLDIVKGDEGAADAWIEHEVPLHRLNHVAFGRVAVGGLVVRRPFGPVTAELCAYFNSVPIHEAESESRSLELECNEQASFVTQGLPPEGGVPTVEPTRPADPFSTNYGRLLLKEEGSIDATSHDLLRSLHNKHLGETVVIVGNGPSLNDTPIEKLSGIPTFAVNGIFYAADRFPDPITYYVVEDTSVFRENTQAIKDFDTVYKLFPTEYRSSFADSEVSDRMAFFRMNGGFYGRGSGTVCHPRFSVDPTQRLYCGQSVTIINLQLAYWMGFSRVVLIGMDFSYTIPDDVERKGDLITSASDDVNHFHPDYFGKGKSWKDPKLDRVLVNYRLAGEMFAADGREIVNSTVGGNLDVFRRMDLLEAVGLAAPGSDVTGPS